MKPHTPHNTFNATNATVKNCIALTRINRPIGIYLLFWPCAWGLLLASYSAGAGMPWFELALFFIGSVAMRSTGCIVNDMADRKIDAQVARTQNRPLASGAMSMRAAAVLLACMCMIGIAILLQLPPLCWALAVPASAMVAAYPFMKRITWWPQAFLGLTFNMGALFGWAAISGTVDSAVNAHTLPLSAWLLYAGGICWTIGYDTIYAYQDIEDDLRVGVKSSAIALSQRLGANHVAVIGLFYAAAVILWSAAGVLSGTGALYYGGVLLAAILLFWQVATLDVRNVQGCLRRFKSNHYVGASLAFSLVLSLAVII